MSLDRDHRDHRDGESVPAGAHADVLDVDVADWRHVAMEVSAAGGRLLALWGSNRAGSGGASLHAVAVTPPRVLLVNVALGEKISAGYPGVADIFPSAARMQRAVFDMTGLRASDRDQRPWLRHAAWPGDFFPLRGDPVPLSADLPIDDYPFVRVEGDGVHEIAVGPVHAGIIEPGHFRFSVVGEKVLRLEERLGYVHKAIELRFRDLRILEGHRLAARVSGDSAVAHAWAYCQALELMTATTLPRRAAWLRALALELERIANHLGDLGALGNDAGFALGLAQFLRLKEQLLRAVQQSLGQRYLLDLVVPGGTAGDLTVVGREILARCIDELAAEARSLREIYDDHTGLRDRFSGAGTLDAGLAHRLGVVGLVGRASGQPLDLRLDLSQEPYVQLGLRRVVQSEGDVLARVAIRFDELAESMRIAREIVSRLPSGGHRVSVVTPPRGSRAVGLIEGWRGPVVTALEAGPDGSIERCHPQDPSWHNWPALEHAIIGNIVPDFPLINKSFNLSYSGHDL